MPEEYQLVAESLPPAPIGERRRYDTLEKYGFFSSLFFFSSKRMRKEKGGGENKGQFKEIEGVL